MIVEMSSYGDRLENGVYHQHTCFSWVVNYISSKNLLVSFVAEEIGAGPKNVVIAKKDIANIPNKPLYIHSDGFHFQNSAKVYYREGNHREYHSHFTAHISGITDSREPGTADNFFENLALLEEHLANSAPKKSLLGLYSEAHGRMFTGAFDRAFYENAKAAVDDIYPGRQYLRGIKRIKGTGFGLTPSGDDFIAGFLVALNVLQWLYPQENQGTEKITEILT
ncbi:MAG: DUF2877 domain-containing protein, partial [bacterium]|nr:DUF2877 domain-containing protein [bacterium]